MAISSASGGLQPLGGITGVPFFRIVTSPDADALTRHGGTADPLHGQHGEQATPYPWEEFAGPKAVMGPAEDAMMGMVDAPEYRTFPAGDINQNEFTDKAPYYSHGGPHIPGILLNPETGPSHLPDGVSDYLRKSAAAHGVKTDSSKPAIASSNPLQDEWDGFFTAVPGDDLIKVDDRQTAGNAFGFAVNDHRNNPFAKVNSFGLATSHRHRRFAVGPIPGNTMWMRPGGRVLLKHSAGTARPPIGEGPFQGQDFAGSFGIDGVILQATPTEYVPPPQPNVVPQAYGAGDSSPSVDLW